MSAKKPSFTDDREAAVAPITFRLPRSGEADPRFGFSRSYYYEGESRGYWKLIRLRDKGNKTGVTLIPYAPVAAFMENLIATTLLLLNKARSYAIAYN